MKPSRHLFLALAAFGLCAASALAQSSWTLITKAESDAEQKRLGQSILVPKSLTVGAPQIEVMEPDLKNDVPAPVMIKVKFVTEGKSALVPDSLRVYYGVFGIDITERLMKKARFENDVLILDRADIPAGKHRLLLKIKDSTDRSAEKLVTLTVR
ncbi:MAG: hypothetical protein V4508_03380 [Pseudomonadota bacterium]